MSGAVRIDRIAVMERLRVTVAAAQNTEAVALAGDQVEEHIARGDIDPAQVGRGGRRPDRAGLPRRAVDGVAAG